MQVFIKKIVTFLLVIFSFAFLGVGFVSALEDTTSEEKSLSESLYPDELINNDNTAYVSTLPGVNEDSSLEESFMPAVMKFIAGSVGGISLTIMLAAGIMMITSFGNTEQREKAQKALYWGILGIAFIFLAYLIVKGITSLQFNQ